MRPCASDAGWHQRTAHAQGRCGYGPRIPLLVVAPYARHNFVDHTMTDQSSIVRFIEDNWLGGQRIPGSFDAIAGPLNNMFDFNQSANDRVILDPQTGEVKFADNAASRARNKPESKPKLLRAHESS